MEEKVVNRAECILRLSSMVLAAISAAIVGLDAQTKTVFFIRKTATSHALQVHWVFTVIASSAACYHFLQLCSSIIACSFLLRKHHPHGSNKSLPWLWLLLDQRNHHPHGSNKYLPWLWLLLDQGVAYVMFAITVAAIQGSVLGVTGLKELQWSKLCNIYTRFCRQIAGGMLCGLAASAAMTIVSYISARRLFQLYPGYN